MNSLPLSDYYYPIKLDERTSNTKPTELGFAFIIYFIM